jgi:Protein of unknown function (DUF3604)
MNWPSLRHAALAGLLAVTLALPAWGQALDTMERMDQATAEQAFKKPGYSPYAGRSFPTRPFFGDTHLHTSSSFDAVAFGNRLGPEEAYRFARGEEVVSSTGVPAKLSRPLDFLVVADHSESIGVLGDVLVGNPMLMADPTVRRWNEMLKQGGESAMNVYYEIVAAVGGGGQLPTVLTQPRYIRSVWQRQMAAAEKYNDPGRFTAFIGYEWSSNLKGNNLHRVVIFRDNAEKAGQTLPVSSVDNPDPESLWQVLAAYEEKTGGSVLAIPHNGNLSNGTMFALADFLGHPLTRQYAETRARWEPLYEVTQIKGDGETHPFLSPKDEFANFERWDKGNLDLSEVKTPEMLPYEYARAALKTGLTLEAQLGVNPYKFGMIGSTDAHTSLAAVEEDNFFGKLPAKEPSDHRWSAPLADFGPGRPTVFGWEQTSSGYAAVWATENTREALWDAMQRKEVYGTTGPRMIVRFFGGWEFEAQDAQNRLPARIGYEKGVPMGGDLRAAPAGKAPTFLVAALKDPIGANLDRYQIVKGWLDAQGTVHENIYDVAWSGDRTPGADGELPAVGSTVDVANATWTNTIGAPELIAVWKDPDFDPAQRAFYYGRVIEIPTPRWTAYDAKYFGLKLPPEVPMTTTERAYTSPIWYTPAP